MRFTEKLNIGHKFEGKPYCLSAVVFFYPRIPVNGLCFQIKKNVGKYQTLRFHLPNKLIEFPPRRLTSKV